MKVLEDFSRFVDSLEKLQKTFDGIYVMLGFIAIVMVVRLVLDLLFWRGK